MHDDRDLFPEERKEVDLDDFRQKLVWATTNHETWESKKKAANVIYNENLKWYKRMRDALAQAIKAKSILPLEQEFGEDHWEQELEKLEAYDKMLAEW